MVSPRPKQISAGVRSPRLLCLSALQATPADQQIAVMIVLADKAFDAGVKIPRQEVVFQEDEVLQGLMPAFKFSLCLLNSGRTTNMIHALVAEPVSQFTRHATRTIVELQVGFAPNGHLIAARGFKDQFRCR